MRIELIVIGNEVLTGFTVNTNASFIGQQLLQEGYVLNRHTVLPDRREVLKEELGQALERSDLVITTGGLGPTVDDVTREIAANLFDSDFHYDEEVAGDIKERFEKYGSKYQDTLKDQATVPSKAKTMLNAVGTAPGFIFSEKDRTLIMLPGVPNEMKPMFRKKALPYITENFRLEKSSFRKVLHLFELPESKVDPYLRDIDEKYPDIECSIYPSLGTLSVHFTTDADSEEEAMKRLEKPFIEVEKQFATNCYIAESGDLEEAVHKIFVENGWTLSLAESCTGGEASSRITARAGASQYFLGSVVSYANSVKKEALNVPEKLLKEKGAVSREVAASMAEGIIQLTGSDFALSVTGIAGPEGGTEEKPVGTVWCAVCRKGEEPHTWKLEYGGTREVIITRSVNSLFSNLLTYTKETSLL